MPSTPSTTQGWNTQQAVGMQRNTAIQRIVNFENLMHRRLGMVRAQRYVRLFNYYSAQNLPPDNVEQPLSINYFRAICDKHTSYLWGQWQNSLLTWRVKPRLTDYPEDGTSKKIEQYLNDLLDQNDGNALLYDASLNGAVFGDSILRLHWDNFERRVVVESILPEWFHCRWDTANMNRLTEVIVSYPMDRTDAQERFGTSGNPGMDYNWLNPEYLPGFAIYWEHWTPTSFRRWIGDFLISEGPNPYMFEDADGNVFPGLIPFVHIPNMRVGGEFWGFSDGENMLGIQDELNRKFADMGDTINNHAHPIVLLSNMQGQQTDLPIGPDAVWDMGIKGEASYLEWKGSSPAATEYLQMLLATMHDTSNLPEIAFGRTRGQGGGGSSGGSSGGRASGNALQTQFAPVVEHAMQKRIYWTIGLKQAARIAAIIHAVKDPLTLPFKWTDLSKYDVTPIWATILPKDRLQTVNEVVARVNSLTMSTVNALETLGEDDIAAEEARIKADAQFKAKLGLLAMSKPGGKNSDRGNGGGSSQQNGPSNKPGSPVKEA